MSDWYGRKDIIVRMGYASYRADQAGAGRKEPGQVPVAERPAGRPAGRRSLEPEVLHTSEPVAPYRFGQAAQRTPVQLYRPVLSCAADTR